ncbi:hypothetical protein BU26DRAFT_75171 [Trematosphaeria pertusa]|uniref:Uncharacterized protein n=1 Tax=Trematosphaeria pertusa TaxID=390896 RepID=A0A6A6I693_9PLEO|nr:uncharacterized protein BU26DRAFT_75171 [Trematosphaeria pertusa]KAF2245749.1 hypothetical protein BU26DRAFT_75171 [Trematosphaeria pertusa]
MCRQYNGKRPDAECREEICNPETSPLTYSCGHCQRCGGYVAPELEMETPPQQRDFERAPAVKREEVPELAQEQGQCASDCFGKYMMCRTPPLANWGKCKSRYCRLDKCHECRFCHEDIAKREDVSGSEPAVKRVEAPELAQEQGVCACFGPFMNCVRVRAPSHLHISRNIPR